MATVRLYKNKYRSTPVSYNLANIDLSDIHNLTEMNQLDANWNYSNGTYAYTGDDVHIIRFALDYPNMTRLTNYINDPDSDQNIQPRPRYKSEKHGTPGADEYVEITSLPELEPVPIGQKPSDWDTSYMRTYFQKGANWEPTGFKIPYYYPATQVWHDDQQYYRDTSVQTMYYTGSQGFFGVSRYCAPLYSVSSTSFLEVVGVALPFGQTSTAESTFAGYTDYLWKSGGYGGTLVNNTTNPYYLTGFTTEGISDITTTMTDGIHFTPNKILVQMCEFDFYDGETYKGVVIVKVNSENIATEARVIAISDVFWTPIDTKYAGPTTSAIGGNGSYNAPDEFKGKRGALSTALIGNIAPGHAGWKLIKADSTDVISDITSHYYQAIINSAGPWFAPWLAALKEQPSDVLEIVQNSILNVYKVPIEPTATNTAKQWQFTGLSFDIDSTVGYGIQHYEYLDCGSVSLGNPWYESFLDYDPFTQVQIYLPFIGTFDLPVSEVMGGTINLEYYQDNLNGDLLARVSCSNSAFPNDWIRKNHPYYEHLIGQFVGNGRMEMPISVALTSFAAGMGQIASAFTKGLVGGGAAGGFINSKVGDSVGGMFDKMVAKETAKEQQRWDNAKKVFQDGGTGMGGQLMAQELNRGAAKLNMALGLQSLAKKAGSVVGGAGTGALVGATLAATGAALSQWKPSSQSVIDSYSGNSGYMSDPTPYIKVIRTLYDQPSTQAHEKGYPANITYKIADLPRHSYNVCSSHVDFQKITNSRMTTEERAAIVNILNSGFYR